MKRLILIPARGGSKGVPHKNIRLLNGKPLIRYTIEAAREIAPDPDICVSTDDEEVVHLAGSMGLKVPFRRPAALTTDEAGMDEVIRHALDHYASLGSHYDTVVLLQPTSPFRTAHHITEALRQFREGTHLVVSVKQTDANPYYVLYEENSEGFLEKSKTLDGLVRRQDAPKVYELNGAIYIIRVSAFREAGSLAAMTRIAWYEMNEKDSLDIDTPLDWTFAEFLMEKKR